MGFYDQQKKNRYERIQTIVEENGPIKKDKLVSKIKVDMGLSEENATDYVEDLLEADKLEKNDDEEIEAV
jgi:predicted transcriptional regulator